MKLRVLVAAAATAALSLVVATSGMARTAAPATAKVTNLTVWLMTDAQSNWPEAVAAANKLLQAKHPDVNVNVQYQGWGDYKTKFEATLASGSGPDVIEFGNTDVPKYSAAGALSPLTASDFPNSSTWLKGLAKAGSYGGKKNPNYSAVYFPGRYWYAAMSFVYDFGGSIAKTSKGKWVGTLDSRSSLAGLNAWKTAALTLSRANKTGDEAHPQQALVFAKGSVGSFIGNGWEWPYALDPKLGNPALKDSIDAYPMPSHTKGKYMPTFLGGSNLGVPVTSKNKSLASEWIAAYTSTSNETLMATAGGVIPNTTSLAKVNASKANLAPFAEAAKYSWFVPSTPNWANVESANVLQNMLSNILRHPSQVKDYASKASAQVAQILNQSS